MPSKNNDNMRRVARYLHTRYVWYASIFLMLLGALAITPAAHADIGVRISPGKIHVDETLSPGGIYQLPPLSVSNNGDETATYQVKVAYHQARSEHRPKAEWLKLKPEEFTLQPEEGQEVQVELNLPLRLRPGEYFVFLEAGPQKRAVQEQTNVGIAAATKLNFTVEPANIWWGIYYKILALWEKYMPWSQIGLGIIVAGLVLFLFKRRYRIRIKRRL